jgi:hypothetical protein
MLINGTLRRILGNKREREREDVAGAWKICLLRSVIIYTLPLR